MPHLYPASRQSFLPLLSLPLPFPLHVYPSSLLVLILLPSGNCSPNSPSELAHYREAEVAPVELTPYLGKLAEARRKVQRANGILKSVQVRPFSAASGR